MLGSQLGMRSRTTHTYLITFSCISKIRSLHDIAGHSRCAPTRSLCGRRAMSASSQKVTLKPMLLCSYLTSTELSFDKNRGQRASGSR